MNDAVLLKCCLC